MRTERNTSEQFIGKDQIFPLFFVTNQLFLFVWVCLRGMVSESIPLAYLSIWCPWHIVVITITLLSCYPGGLPESYFSELACQLPPKNPNQASKQICPAGSLMGNTLICMSVWRERTSLQCRSFRPWLWYNLHLLKFSLVALSNIL